MEMLVSTHSKRTVGSDDQWRRIRSSTARGECVNRWWVEAEIAILPMIESGAESELIIHRGWYDSVQMHLTSINTNSEEQGRKNY